MTDKLPQSAEALLGWHDRLGEVIDNGWGPREAQEELRRVRDEMFALAARVREQPASDRPVARGLSSSIKMGELASAFEQPSPQPASEAVAELRAASLAMLQAWNKCDREGITVADMAKVRQRVHAAIRALAARVREQPVRYSPDEFISTLNPSVLHILRNPYGHPEEIVRASRLAAADHIEKLERAPSAPSPQPASEAGLLHAVSAFLDDETFGRERLRAAHHAAIRASSATVPASHTNEESK